MSDVHPIHLVSDRDAVGGRIAAAFAPRPVTEHRTLENFESALGDTTALVILDPDGGVPWADAVALCRRVCDHEIDAIVFFLDGDGSGPTLHPLSVGPSISLEGAAGALDPDAEEWPPFELHQILAFIARIRHDINNPLTAGMAENQLLLMDLGEEGEVGESLTTIQRQLVRIQGMVQELGRVRRPPPTEE